MKDTKQDFDKILNWLESLPPELKIMAKEKLLSPGILDYKPKEIKMLVDSRMEFYRLSSCAKEPGTVEWIEKTVSKNDIFYDIGANTGSYSLVAAAVSSENFRVFAFEPVFFNYSALCRNIISNDFGHKITPFAVALSDTSAVTPLLYSGVVPGSSSHSIPPAGGGTVNYNFSLPAISFSLDHFIGTFNLPFPDHIKLDIDGEEFRVLKGAEKTIKNSSLQTVMVEVERKNLNGEISRFLSDCGFTLSEVFPLISENLANCLFTRN